MWARYLTIGLGVWLMAAPGVLAYGPPAAHVDSIAGTLAMASAIVAMWEITRPARWIPLALGACLVVAPWLAGYDAPATMNSLVVGGLLGAFAFVKGPVRARFGGGWSSLWEDETS